MVQANPFFRLLDFSLSGLIPREPVEVFGEWSTSTRKTYQSEMQRGGGVGPFVDVEDRRWRGTLRCPNAASGMAFLLTATKVYWAKAPTVASTLPVQVSIHAYAGYRGDRATFAAGMAGAVLPGVPVAVPVSLAGVCAGETILFHTGRVVAVAHTESAAFVAVVLGLRCRQGLARRLSPRPSVVPPNKPLQLTIPPQGLRV